MHPSWAAAELAVAEAEYKQALTFAQHVATTFAFWLQNVPQAPPRQKKSKKRRERGGQKPQVQETSHIFMVQPLAPERCRWKCMACHRTTGSLQSQVAKAPCIEHARQFRDVIIAEHGHHLLGTTFNYDDGCEGALITCRLCGAYATERTKLLAQQCRGYQTQRNRIDWSSICNRQHPKSPHIVLQPLLRL